MRIEVKTLAERQEWLKSLTVGDEVFFGRTGTGRAPLTGKITRMTQTVALCDCGRRFMRSTGKIVDSIFYVAEYTAAVRAAVAAGAWRDRSETSAERTLRLLGFIDEGGPTWKPPQHLAAILSDYHLGAI